MRSTLEDLLEDISNEGWFLDALRQIDEVTWYASLRKGDNIVYSVTAEAYAPTASSAVRKAILNMKRINGDG